MNFVVEGDRGINGVLRVGVKDPKGRYLTQYPRAFLRRETRYFKMGDGVSLEMRVILKLTLCMPGDRGTEAFSDEAIFKTTDFIINKFVEWMKERNISFERHVFEFGGSFWEIDKGYAFSMIKLKEVNIFEYK